MSRLVSFFVFTLLTASVGFAQVIDGKWKGQMESPNGPVDLVFSFKVSGDTLTGSVESPMGVLPIINSKLDSNKFSFDVNAGEMTISHDCSVMGDSISMKVPWMQGDSLEIILKRLVDAEKESK
jgi:hypothetical protein